MITEHHTAPHSTTQHHTDVIKGLTGRIFKLESNSRWGAIQFLPAISRNGSELTSTRHYRLDRTKLMHLGRNGKTTTISAKLAILEFLGYSDRDAFLGGLKPRRGYLLQLETGRNWIPASMQQLLLPSAFPGAALMVEFQVLSFATHRRHRQPPTPPT